MANTPSDGMARSRARFSVRALMLAVVGVCGVMAGGARAGEIGDPLWEALEKLAAGPALVVPEVQGSRPGHERDAAGGSGPVELVVELDLAPGAPALPFRLDIVRASARGEWRAAGIEESGLALAQAGRAAGRVPPEGARASRVECELINGRERIGGIEGVAVYDDRGAEPRAWVMLRIPAYDAALYVESGGSAGEPAGDGREAAREVGRVAWVTPRPGGEVAVVGGRARFAAASGERFAALEAGAGVAAGLGGFGGTWRVRFATDPDEAVGRFTVDERTGEAAGTFLTTTGDARFLAGRVDGRTLRLSAFDGAHAFLYRASLGEGGATLAGEFWSGTWHHEAWAGVRDDGAALADGFAQTRVVGDVGELEALTLTDTGGAAVAVGAVAPAGTPRIVELFGSWCPNCHDAAELMKELDRAYGPRGLRVVGLALEHQTDAGAARRRVESFVRRRGIGYPVLVAAGLSDKAKASAALGFLDQFKAFPTTIFIGRDGAVRAVHTGFSGPATGESHVALRARFYELAEELVRE